MSETTLTVPPAVIEEAERTILAFASTHMPWPDDTWVSIGPSWDLNIYADGDADDPTDSGKPAATLYPVSQGRTNTSQCFQLDMARILAGVQ